MFTTLRLKVTYYAVLASVVIAAVAGRGIINTRGIIGN
jgi:hypothetical protein